MIRHNTPTRVPADWVPPVPAFSANVSEPVTIAYYGIQARAGRDQAEVREFQAWCDRMRHAKPEPTWVEHAEYVDELGQFTWVAMFYWRGPRALYEEWRESGEHQLFWESSDRETGDAGVFREVFHVPNDRLETIYSDPDIDSGLGGGLDEHDGPIQSHNYWGSMRDRLPGSSSDLFEGSEIGEKAGRFVGLGQRIVLEGIDNLATIRSGQLFDELEGREKEVYFSEIEPSLREGMLYLRDNPEESGCFSCRHMTETDGVGKEISRTFAVAHFDSLTHMEEWSESHPTHLRIFKRFIELATELKGNVKLRLWHEVVVTNPDMQELEYVNCSPSTGLLPFARESASERVTNS